MKVDPLLKYSRLRLVDLEYRSFSIGVSADNLMGNEKIPSKDIVDWRQNKVLTYKNEIIEVDYS